MTVFLYYFGWPDGAVWSNLLASVIWAAPALIHLHLKLNRHHREQLGHVKGPRRGLSIRTPKGDRGSPGQ